MQYGKSEIKNCDSCMWIDSPSNCAKCDECVSEFKPNAEIQKVFDLKWNSEEAIAERKKEMEKCHEL